MEQDVEANPTFRGTGAFRIVATDFFWRLPCGVRLVHVDRDGANFGFAFDALFGDGRQVDFMEFRNDTLENSSYDILLGEQALGVLIVGGIRIAEQQILGIEACR